MSDLNEITDRIHYQNRRDYTSKHGNVAYLDGTPLARPFSMPAAQRVIALIIIIAAVVIGYLLVNRFVISQWQAAEASEKAIAHNLSRQPSIETIPNMMALSGLDDAGIKTTLAEQGNNMFDLSSVDESYDMALYRIPQDVTLDEAMSYLLSGLGSLDAEDASKLLVGGWLLGVDRVNGTSMVVRYADFSTGDPQIAIQNAIIREGFDTSTISDSGEDDSGNTYSMGSYALGETPGTWKVSALPLKDVYSIVGLPENACYVGVRVTHG